MFRGSIRLFRIGGIQLSAHVSFLLLLAYVGWDGWRSGGALTALTDVGSLLVFFTCVVLHELGHSFTARAFGVKVPRILLLPIGGMAEFTSVPKKPSQEILIALAGPAVNFVILLVLAIFGATPSWQNLRTLELSPLQALFTMNLIMGCFNLLPAFPMDGGRVLRAFLAQHFSYLQATRWAAHIGKILALAGMLAALFVLHNPLTAALFLFIMIAGELEYRAVLRQEKDSNRGRDMIDPGAVPPPLWP